MKINNVKIAWRNLLAHKGYTTINVLGLATGVAACLLIVLFVKDERSFDRYHTHADRVYRVVVDGLWGNTSIHQIYTPAQLASTLVKDFPEVEDAVRLGIPDKPMVEYDGRSYTDFLSIATDSSFFNVFTMPVVQGLSRHPLTDPRSVVITQSTAKVIFGTESPIGKVLKIRGEEMTVTTVVRDVPHNSHFTFDVLTSLKAVEYAKNGHWMMNNFVTYFLAKKDADVRNIESKFPGLLSKNLSWFDDWLKQGNHWRYYLQPLTSIHLRSDLTGELGVNGNVGYVYLFSAVALFILLLACINFVNLTTAKSVSRYKEIGIKKVVGSNKKGLILQFLTESMFISSVGVLVGLSMAAAALPWFDALTGKNLKMSDFFDWYMVLSVLLLTVVIGILSGSFPAFYMSSVNVLNALRNNTCKATKGLKAREVLVVFQFSVSIFLIAFTLLVMKQLNYFQHKKLGYDKSNILVVERVGLLNNQTEPFKNELLQNPWIIGATYSQQTTVSGYWNWACQPQDRLSITLNINIVDNDFLKTYAIEMLEGRFFSNEYPSDQDGIVINEAAAKLMGYSNPLGMRISGWDKDRTIIGVVKNFHYESMRSPVKPACLLPLGGAFSRGDYLSVKVRNEHLSETIQYLKSTWNKYVRGVPFHYSFLDENYERLYETERRMGVVLSLFSVLAILIACLGLIGLASYTAAQKTKEIGVRKVNGSTVIQIILLINRTYVLSILFALLMVAPIVWYAMQKWLEQFAYKTPISWWILVLAGLSAVVVAVFTLSWHSWKAAVKNPVEALRYE